VGDVVAAQFPGDGKWYRAKVHAVSKNDYDDTRETLSIDFVDFGDCFEKRKGDLLTLRAEFLQLSFQAIKCTMARIVPAK
jgi:hypothetical protein